MVSCISRSAAPPGGPAQSRGKAVENTETVAHVLADRGLSSPPTPWGRFAPTLPVSGRTAHGSAYWKAAKDHEVFDCDDLAAGLNCVAPGKRGPRGQVSANWSTRRAGADDGARSERALWRQGPHGAYWEPACRARAGGT